MMVLWCACIQEKSLDTSSQDSFVYEAPQELEHWRTGNTEDMDVDPNEAILLIGGGLEPDDAFLWWNEQLQGGDVVVLRVSGSDGYNTYLYTDIGGVNSVETLKVDSLSMADDPYVAQQIMRAEGVFLAGGDQWDYLSLWTNTRLHEAIQEHIALGKPIGGTSAGLAVLGSWIFSAQNGTVYSEEVLLDPYNEYVQFAELFVSLPLLEGVITDSHFSERARLGRLIGFVGRLRTEGMQVQGWGIDESTAFLIDAEGSQVVGAGSVFVINPEDAPQRCVEGEPLTWEHIPIEIHSPQGDLVEFWTASQGVMYQE